MAPERQHLRATADGQLSKKPNGSNRRPAALTRSMPDARLCYRSIRQASPLAIFGQIICVFLQ